MTLKWSQMPLVLELSFQGSLSVFLKMETKLSEQQTGAR